MALMKLFVLAVISAAFLSGQPQNPAMTNPNEIVLTVGDHKITAIEYQFLVRMLLTPKSQDLAYGPNRRQFAQKIAEAIILSDEAIRHQIDKNPDMVQKLQFHDDNLLAQAMLQKIQQTLVVPESDIQSYYDAHKSDYEVLNARRILIRVKGSPMPALPGKPELTDAEAHAKADSIHEQIVAGADFAKLAQQESDDANSRLKGGDVGALKRGATNPQFEQAAFALKPGEISQPLKTTYGYDIIQVESRSFRSLAEVKEDVVNRLRPQLAPKAVDELITKAKVTISDEYFGPEPAAQGK